MRSRQGKGSPVADAHELREQGGRLGGDDAPEGLPVTDGAARMVAEAAAGQCALHPWRQAVAAIVGRAFSPKGACEACAAFAENCTTYTVYHRPVPARSNS
jgi:hypothetical protein